MVFLFNFTIFEKNIIKIMKDKKTKRELILQTSSNVFVRDGYNNAKMSDIARLAGIGTGTIYLYFENKEQILKELLVNYWTIVYQQILNAAERKSMTTNEKIYDAMVNIIEKAYSFPEIAQLVVQEFTFWNDPKFEKLNKIIEKTKHILAKIIDEGINKGDLNSRLNPNVAVSFIIGGVWHLIEYSVQFKQKFTLEVLKEQAKIMISESFLK